MIESDLICENPDEKIPNFSKVDASSDKSYLEQSNSDKNSKNESEEDHPYFFGSP